MSFHQRRWQEPDPRDQCLPAVTWREVEAALTEMATTEAKRRMAGPLVSGVRKQAARKPAAKVIEELFCLAWLLGDETFDPAEAVSTD